MKIVPSNVNCKDVVNEVVDKYRSQAQKKGLVIQIEIPDGDVRCYTGRNQLVEVISQLVSNAIKYTDKGSITVKLEDLGDEVKFSVMIQVLVCLR
jgi:signal transduction histidine kinase